jgi:hypothetical protein
MNHDLLSIYGMLLCNATLALNFIQNLLVVFFKNNSINLRFIYYSALHRKRLLVTWPEKPLYLN